MSSDVFQISNADLALVVLAQSGDSLTSFEIMKHALFRDRRPNVVTITRVLSDLLRRGLVQPAEQIQWGLTPDGAAAAALVMDWVHDA